MSSIDIGVWPVPIHDRHGAPVVSDPFGRDKREGRGHLGVDIMFKRSSKGEFDRPEQTPWYRMPDGIHALACANGTVWSVQKQRQGFVVRIDHGFPWLSVYRHLKNPLVQGGEQVAAGAPIGTIGHDPTNDNGINHLHFEIWDTSIGSSNTREARSVDPSRWLARWDKVSEEGASSRGPHLVGAAAPQGYDGSPNDGIGEASVVGTSLGGTLPKIG